MGIKNSKGSVSLEHYRNRLRLRGRHQGIRYSLNLSAYNQLNILQSKKIALQIEQDIITENFDPALVKYSISPENRCIKPCPFDKEVPLLIQIQFPAVVKNTAHA